MKVISILNNIYEKAGGVTRVSMYRTESFESTGFDSAVATLALNNKLNEIINNLISISTISEKLKVINFYSSLSYAHKHNLNLPDVFSSHHKESLKEKVKRKKVYPRDSMSTLVKYFNSNDELFLEEYFNEEGFCTCVLYYHREKGCLQFSSKDSIHAFWLSELKGTSDGYYIADAIMAAKSVCMISDLNAYKILMAHSNHLLLPRTIGSRLAPKYKDVFDYNKLSDAFVLLTHHQLEDIKVQFNISKKCYVIPNPIKTVNKNLLGNKKENFAIILARLDRVKQIDKIIKAFKSIVSLNQNAVLEIWGDGAERDNLKALVKSNKLDNNVKFMGFSKTPHRELSRATVALSMSSAEGFGVSIAEALSCGTPVVSIKTKYGPTDIITNGEDGFLVNNEKEFIEKTGYLLNNPDAAIEMGKKGISSSSRFMSEQIIEQWVGLFNKLKKDKASGVEYSFPGKSIKNTIGTKLGWIYLDKNIKQAAALEESGSIFIRNVNKNISFDGICELEPQIYDIEKVSFDAKKEVYRFRVLSKGEIYKGVIPPKSIEFVILK
ncbi:glycosyltransferase [Psychrobacter celer]|uniref:glycosyltransferase n=1 Tax=Psychrobacter celer TaxID=306572 RepID=UPI003FD55192